MATLYDTPHVIFDEATKSHHIEWTPTPMDLIRKQVMETIAADRDGKIRQALIELGWTPFELWRFLQPYIRSTEPIES